MCWSNRSNLRGWGEDHVPILEESRRYRFWPRFWFYTWKLYIHIYNILFSIIYYNNYHYYCIIIYMPSKYHFCQWFEDQNTWVVVGEIIHPQCLGLVSESLCGIAKKISGRWDRRCVFGKRCRWKVGLKRVRCPATKLGHLRYSFNTFWYSNCSML